MSEQVAFYIGGVPIYGDLILAPLAGYSDQPYRAICREMGSAVSYTECIPVTGFLHDNWRCIEMTRFVPEDRPIALQAVGSDPDVIIEACQRMAELSPDIIDINMGCPATRVSHSGGGAGLLRDESKIARIFAALSKRLSVPVTGKIRLGWDEHSRNYLRIARVLEDNGAASIAVHGRTRSQKYDVPADWNAIAEVKEAVRIPVIGNGDVASVADTARMRACTGCDAVMIGRGAIGNPWIFQRRDLENVPVEERIRVIRRHLDGMIAFYGEERGVSAFRKHIVRYLRGIPGAAHARAEMMTCVTGDEVVARLHELVCLHGTRNML
jgi:tRNA-dihydrouridine synthase B